MRLSDTGESRVRGYLYILERSLRSSVTPALTADAVREVESHIRERVAESDGMPNEREALERILNRLGAPSTVARAYSLEILMDEAAVGGRFVPVIRSLFHAAMSGTLSFFAALLLFTGYVSSLSFLLIAALKPIFPNNVGLWIHNGISFGARFPVPPGVTPLGGYWVIPVAIAAGLFLFVATHRLARRWVSGLRERMRKGVPA